MNEDPQAPVYIYGEKALKAKLDVVRGLVAKKSEIALCALELFHVFAYMLLPAEAEFVKKTTQAVVARSSKASAGSAGGSASSSSTCALPAAAVLPTTHNSKSSGSASDAKSAVLSLFKN